MFTCLASDNVGNTEAEGVKVEGRAREAEAE